MRIFKPFLIAAFAVAPLVAMAQTTVVERSHVMPYTSGFARGLPGVASPWSVNTIIPVNTGESQVTNNAGAGG